MLDKIDYSILDILLLDAKVTYQEIGKQLSVSQGTVHARVRKMIESGIIKGSKIEVNYSQLGHQVNAFVGLNLSQNSLYDSVLASLKEINEVVEVHNVTGNYCFIIKVICKDVKHFREVLAHKIQAIEGILNSQTFLSLDACFTRPLMTNVD